MDRLGSLRNQRARQLASVALISTGLAFVAAPRTDALAASADLRGGPGTDHCGSRDRGGSC